MINSGKLLFSFRGPMGVPVEVHSSIIFLGLIFIGFSGSGTDMAYGLAFFALIVLAIFLHEMGHAWGALVQGVPVRRVVIYGGGGFCEQARSASAHETELIVAMGPIVNFGLWAGISLLYSNFSSGLVFGSVELTWALKSFVVINFFLGILNMIPVMPLDGGRLLQLGLMRIMPQIQATRLAGGIGLVLSVLWFPAMFFCFFLYGLVLFFFPSIKLHLKMLRAGR